MWKLAPKIQKVTIQLTLPETNSLLLKMDGWNTTFLLGRRIFRGELLVSGRLISEVIFVFEKQLLESKTQKDHRTGGCPVIHKRGKLKNKQPLQM